MKNISEEIIEFETKIKEKMGALKRALKIEDNEKNVIEIAKQKLKETTSEIDFKLRGKFNQEKLEKLETSFRQINDEIKKLEKKLENHKIKISHYSQELLRLEINTILNDEFNLMVENLDSLIVSIEKLNQYIMYIENRADVCRNALEIFDEIEEDERNQINQLFDKDSICVNFFKKITGRNYIDISFKPEMGEIYVKKRNNEELSAYKLSESTFDQLYLAIRVDLAQRILEGEKGFLIMDDIFLSYDTNRLKEGINILKELSDLGWQIIYFTAKDFVCELFTEVIKSDVVRLKPL